MSIRSTVILCIVLVILGSFYYFYDIKGKEAREQAAVEARRLFKDLDPDDVIHIEIERRLNPDNLPENTQISEEEATYLLSFSRSGSLWKIEKPVDTPADRKNISSLLKKVVNLQSERSIPIESDDELKAYGVDTPGFIIRFKTRNDVHECRLGNENPTHQYFYAGYDNEKNVVLVSSDLKHLLTKKLYYYRDKRVLPFDEDQVGKLRYQIEDHPAIEISKMGDEWRLEAPVEAAGDRYRIDDLISSLMHEKAHEFISENPESLDEYGLEDPYLHVDLWEGENNTLHTLLVGKYSDESGKFRFAMRPGFKPVFTVSMDLINKFSVDPFAFQSKDVCNFQRDLVKTIKIRYPNETIVIQRDTEGDWHVETPDIPATDSAAVGGFLSDLSFLKATGVKPAGTDFGTTLAEIELLDEKGQPVQSVILGDEATEAAGRWVKTSSSDIIFRISDTDVDRLTKHADDFRDKTLLSFKRYKLKKITIKTRDGELSFEPDGDDFRIIKPGKGTFDQDTLFELAWTLNPVKMTSESDTIDPEQTGLDKPSLTVVVEENDTTHAPLYFGKKTNDGKYIFARSGDDGPVYLVSVESVKHLLDLKL